MAYQGDPETPIPNKRPAHVKNAGLNVHVLTDLTDTENARLKRASTRTRRVLKSLNANMHWTQDSPQMGMDEQE